jgi:hypothetical protein
MLNLNVVCFFRIKELPSLFGSFGGNNNKSERCLLLLNADFANLQLTFLFLFVVLQEIDTNATREFDKKFNSNHPWIIYFIK